MRTKRISLRERPKLRFVLSILVSITAATRKITQRRLSPKSPSTTSTHWRVYSRTCRSRWCQLWRKIQRVASSAIRRLVCFALAGPWTPTLDGSSSLIRSTTSNTVHWQPSLPYQPNPPPSPTLPFFLTVSEVLCRYQSGSTCNFVPPCYQAKCLQRYNTQKLLVIDPAVPHRGPFRKYRSCSRQGVQL